MSSCRCLVLATFFFPLLLGCATNKESLRYFGPESGPKARLRVITLPGNNSSVWEGTQTGCFSQTGRLMAMLGSVMLFDEGRGRRVGIPLIEDAPPKLTAEFIIPAERSFTVEVSAVTMGFPLGVYYFCRRALSFQVDENTDYEAVYQLAGPNACSISLAQIISDSNGFARKPVNAYTVSDKKCP